MNDAGRHRPAVTGGTEKSERSFHSCSEVWLTLKESFTSSRKQGGSGEAGGRGSPRASRQPRRDSSADPSGPLEAAELPDVLRSGDGVARRPRRRRYAIQLQLSP